MGYRDDPKTQKHFCNGSESRKMGGDGASLNECPFKRDCPSKRAWELGWKTEDDKLSPRQVTEKEWIRRIKRERHGEHLPTNDHLCTIWDAAECACQGTCGCHYQGSIRHNRVGLVRMDHICSYFLPRNHWVVLVHGQLNPFDSDHWVCEGCQEALAKGEMVFREGEILTVEEVVKEYEKGRRCFHSRPDHGAWRHLF